MEYLEQLQDIVRDVLDDDQVVLSRETVASDVEDWDSLAQINIIVACESTFGVTFDMEDIQGLKTVGDMLDLIERVGHQ